jgi:hypothetical protein
MTDNEYNEAEEIITETIHGAEEVRDPLEGLVDKTRIDPGAPFTPEVLERLAALKKDDRAAFETLRAHLKSAGCRVTGSTMRSRRKAEITVGAAHHRRKYCWTSRKPSICFTHPTEPALPISISLVIARPGRSAPRAFVAGWPADSSSRPMGRRIPRRCNQRST